jgi:hypothetical protein
MILALTRNRKQQLLDAQGHVLSVVMHLSKIHVFLIISDSGLSDQAFFYLLSVHEVIYK